MKIIHDKLYWKDKELPILEIEILENIIGIYTYWEWNPSFGMFGFICISDNL